MGKRVDPIRKLEDIKRIKASLVDRPRDHALFVVGINVALRAIDLLSIKAGQVKDLAPGEYFFIAERKTSKRRSVIINKESHRAIHRYLSRRHGLLDTDPLFPSRKGVRTAISRYWLNRMVQSWCEGIKGDYGSHSLRKTWGAPRGASVHIKPAAESAARVSLPRRSEPSLGLMEVTT